MSVCLLYQGYYSLIKCVYSKETLFAEWSLLGHDVF